MNRNSKIENLDIAKDNKLESKTTKKIIRCTNTCFDKLKHKMIRNVTEKRLDDEVKHLILQENIFQKNKNVKHKNHLKEKDLRCYHNTNSLHYHNLLMCKIISQKTPQITVIINNNTFIINKKGLHTLHLSNFDSKSSKFAQLMYDLYHEFYVNE